MDIKTRLFRRPLTTILWSILVISISLLVGVGSALRYSSSNLLPILDGLHTSVAMRTDRASESIKTDRGAIWTMESKYFTQDDYDYFMGLEAVKDIYFHSLTGGYIPELLPALGVQEQYGNYSEYYDNANESYDDIVLKGTVLRVLEEYEPYTMDMSMFGFSTEEPCRSIALEVRIDELLYAHPDYCISDGELYDGLINIIVKLCGADAQDYFQLGEQYLFNGEYDPGVRIYSGWPQDAFHPFLTTAPICVLEGNVLQGYEYMYNSAEQEFMCFSKVPAAEKLSGFELDSQWESVLNNYKTALHHFPVIGTENLEAFYLFLSEDASIISGRSFTQEEYDSGAKVCILSQTLANKAGISVGDTVHLSQFLCNEDFNQSIDPSAVDGMLNNPTVGEPMLDIEYLTQNEVFTVVGLYRQTNEWEQTSYSITPNTIFIPKTAQIPGGFGEISTTVVNTAVDTEGNEFTYKTITEQGCYGIYFSILIENGSMDEFALSISGTDWADQFHTFGQGYDGLIDSVDAVAQSSEKLFLFSVLGWGIVVLLYVLLFQNGQKKNLGIMRSLGTKPGQAKHYLFGSGFALISVCILLGTGLTATLISKINSSLLGLMTSQITMEQYSGGMELSEDILNQMVTQCQIPTSMLIGIAVAQILLIGCVLWIHAGVLAKKAPRKLMGV